MLEQVNKNHIDQQLDRDQEYEQEINQLKGQVQSFEFLLDMRESYFTQLQKMALVIARKIQSMP